MGFKGQTRALQLALATPGLLASVHRIGALRGPRTDISTMFGA